MKFTLHSAANYLPLDSDKLGYLIDIGFRIQAERGYATIDNYPEIEITTMDELAALSKRANGCELVVNTVRGTITIYNDYLE